MGTQGTRGRTFRLLGLALAAAVGLAAADAQADSRKMSRQIRMFERVIDDMLVESPNWLVQGRHECRGIYVEGHGAIFTFDASLVNGGRDYHDRSWFKWNWWNDDDDRRVIIIDDDWEDEEDEDSDRASRRELRDKWFERDMKRQERRYTRGKSEVVEVIADFGDLLSTLADSDVIEIEAFLEGASYFYEEDLERLSLRAKMSDVRAFADGSIDEKTLVERIQTKES